MKNRINMEEKSGQHINTRQYLGWMLTVSLLTIVSGLANPEGRPATPPREILRQWDMNGDGVIAVHEFPGPMEHFIDLDRNQDGYLTEDEIARRPPPPPLNLDPRSFIEADMNEDGVISVEEFLVYYEIRFNHLDRNSDGVISRDELPKPHCLPRPYHGGDRPSPRDNRK